MELEIFSNKLMDFELAQAITRLKDNQFRRYVPRNHDERVLHKEALARDALKFDIAYPSDFQTIIEQFVTNARNTVFLDGKGNPDLTKWALHIRDKVNIWNPFPSGPSNTNQKVARRQDAALIGLVFMMLFHPETKGIFGDRYYKVFALPPPKRRKERELFEGIWRDQYSEDRDVFIQKYSKTVVENHLFLLAMELIASGSYLGKSIIDRYQFLIEIFQVYPWYTHSGTGSDWKEAIRYEIQRDFLKLEHQGKKPPLRDSIIDRYSRCLSGHLDVFRRSTIDILPAKNHPAAGLRDLIADGSIWGSSYLESSESEWLKYRENLASMSAKSFFAATKKLRHKNLRSNNSLFRSDRLSHSAVRQQYLKKLFGGLSRDAECCYLTRLILFRGSVPLFRESFEKSLKCQKS